MIVVISQLVGITDVGALIGIAGANVSMILFGWLQEKYEQPGGGGWLPFVFGCIAGLVPWLAILYYTIAPGSDAEPPGFVYAIVGPSSCSSTSSASTSGCSTGRREGGRTTSSGSAAYIILSLVAKSLLAWQVFRRDARRLGQGHGEAPRARIRGAGLIGKVRLASVSMGDARTD